MANRGLNLRTSRRSLLAAAGAGSLSALLAGCSTPGAPRSEYTIVAAHAVAEIHFHHRTFVKFKELIEERTDGRIGVQIFSSGVFGGDRELTEAVQLNNIQLAMPSTSPVAAFSPNMNVFDMPFLFDNREHVYRVLDQGFCQTLLDDLWDIHLTGLAYCENGFRNLTTKNVKVQHPDDMRGIKIRTLENPTQIRAWNATGASATPMAFTEVYTGLQQGTVDAQENPFALIASQRFYEVQDYAIRSEHVYSPSPLLMSRAFFSSLPDDLQDVVREVAVETRDYCRSESLIDEEASIKLIEEDQTEMVDLPEEGRLAFREVMLGAAEPYVRSILGDDPVDQLMSALEEAR